MAFIDKKDPIVLNIKLTSKGRELISKGNLNFKYFAIGDSEIDYNFNNETNFNPFNSLILRPADKNPNILSFITKNNSGDSYNLINNVPSTPTIIQNTVQPIGFFSINSGTTTFITDSDHVKQPDVMIRLNTLSGGTLLKLFKAPTYQGNVNEPQIGDLLLIKWTNPYSINTTGYSVNVNYPTPYLIYKIQDIASGTLSNNNLIIQVDRNLPDFSKLIGGSSNVVAGALVYYNYINYTGTSIFNNSSTDYINEEVIAFLQNSQCPTITFPFWNMSIVYTDNIIGVQTTNKNFGEYKSNVYGGFVSYIQNQAPVLKKLGIIHYTNSSPSNTYAEELYKNTPTLNLPTIMWHKSPNKKLGLTLKAIGDVKTLTGVTRSLNTTYYNLGDLQGNIVGKIFNDLKIFVIEDQEILFAMSYKSNRSWTLPNYNVGINDNIIIGCNRCLVTYNVSGSSPSIINGTDGKINIYNIQNNSGQLILEVLSGTNRLYYQPITGNTLVNNLNTGNYIVKLYDLGSPNCVVTSGVTISNPTGPLYLYDAQITPSGLIPDFNITQIRPTNIKILQSDIGITYGTPSIGIKSYGAPDFTIQWQSFNLGEAIFNDLTFTLPYTIVTRDTGGLFDFMLSRDYVAVGNPLYSLFTLNQNSDSGGKYVTISNYLLTITNNFNPIVGTIEFNIHPSTSSALNWETVSTVGAPKKLYVNGTGNYVVSIRERLNNIIMFTVSKNINIV